VVAKRKPAKSDEDAVLSEKTRMQLMRLIAEGFAEWDGGKPTALEPRVVLTPGPDISDYIHEDRR
jgi:hypothetical protein